jgi:protein gp37
MQMRFNGGKPFDGTIAEHPERMADILPKSLHRKPRVWTYWNDIFHEGVTDVFRDKLFEIIKQTSDYHIICTKRPREILRYWNNPNTPLSHNMYFPKVIYLVTMENQEMVNKRYPTTAKLATMGWNVGVLAEPMLAPLNLCLDIWPVLPKWIITGPENGPGKRLFDPQWALSLRDQAAAARIPFMFKGGPLDGKEYLSVPEI